MASDSPPNGRNLQPVHPLFYNRGGSEACSAQEPRRNGKETEHLVICSEEMLKEAEKFSLKLTSEMETCRIITSTDKSIFDQERLPLSSFTTLYLFVDSPLATTMLRKGRLHNSVYDFFDAVDEENKVVYVANKFDKKDRMFNEILYQLPGGCTKEMKDILVTSEPKQNVDMLEIDTDSDSDSEEEESQEGPKVNHQAVLDAENGNSGAEKLEIQQAAGAAEKLQALSLIEDTEKTTDSSSMSCMIGSHCTMNITPSSNQLVIARQDGSENIVNVKIVPSSETSHLIIIMTTDPNSPELEELLVKEIDAKKEVLNIKLKSSDAQIVSVRKGSVIIEIEVEPGQTMGSEWVDTVVKTVLQSELRTVIPLGTQLNLDIESNLVVPSEALGNHVDLGLSHAALEKIHRDKTHSAVPIGELTQTLESVVNYGIKSESGDVDYTDVIISLLDVLADLHEDDPWAHAIKHPHLFSAGGIFYRQVERDVGLSHEKHFQLPSFPGKLFLYNAKSQSIELCVDPHGHYPIGPDIEIRIHKKIPPKKSGKVPVGGKDTKVESKRIKQNIRGKSPQKHEKMVAIHETSLAFGFFENDDDEVSLYNDKQSGIEETKKSDSGLSDLPRFSDMDEGDSITQLIKRNDSQDGKEKAIQTDSGLSDVY